MAPKTKETPGIFEHRCSVETKQTAIKKKEELSLSPFLRRGDGDPLTRCSEGWCLMCLTCVASCLALAARSLYTTAAWPSLDSRARYIGVCPFCGTRLVSGNPYLSPPNRLKPPPLPRPSFPNGRSGANITQRQKENSMQIREQLPLQGVWGTTGESGGSGDGSTKQLRNSRHYWKQKHSPQPPPPKNPLFPPPLT